MKAFKNKMKRRHVKTKVFWTTNSTSYQKYYQLEQRRVDHLKNYTVNVFSPSILEKCKKFHQCQNHHSTKQNFYYYTHTIKCPEV